MKIEPIEISTDDTRLFTDLCQVLDQDKFLSSISKAREELNVNKLLSLEEYHQHKRDIYGTPSAKNLAEIIDSIRKRFHLPIVYQKTIEKSIFLGKVGESDYSPAMLISLPETTDDDEGTLPDFSYAILLSPHVSNKQINKAAQEYRDQLGNEKAFKNKAFKYDFIPDIRKHAIKKNATQHHRDWYWKYKNGKSVNEIIAESTNECKVHGNNPDEKIDKNLCSCLDYKTVSDGIESYLALLQESRDF